MSTSPPSSPIIIQHPLQGVTTLEEASNNLSEKEYPMRLAKADNNILDSVQWQETTCASLTHPAAEKIILKKAKALLHSFAENFGIDWQATEEELAGNIGSVLEDCLEKALNISIIEMKNTNTLNEEILRVAADAILNTLETVTRLAYNLIETIQDLCLRFSNFIGDLEGLEQQIRYSEEFTRGITIKYFDKISTEDEGMNEERK